MLVISSILGGAEQFTAKNRTSALTKKDGVVAETSKKSRNEQKYIYPRGTGEPAGLGCSGAGREQCGVPAASVPPHPSQPLHLARRPASPAALGQQPRLAADIGQGGPTADPQQSVPIFFEPEGPRGPHNTA